MKNRRHLKALRLFLIVLALTFFCCQDQSGRWSQAWELRFEDFQPSDYVMDTFGVRPGMTVAEIGAGNGRFAVRLAARAGNRGLVYANDIDPKALKFMHNRILNEQISNLVIIKGEINHPHLPENELDLVCLVNTYDDLSHPIELLKNCRSSLKSNGSLTIMVYDTDKVGNLQGHAVSRQTVIRQAEAVGYELSMLDDSLSRDTIYIFIVK